MDREAASRASTLVDRRNPRCRVRAAAYNSGVMERTASDLQEHLTNGVAADAALATLSPPVARWFCQRFGEPTTAQRLAWPAIAAGRHLLLSAPTGAGKTLAAFLPILSRLLDTATTLTGGSVRCLYIAPLKALGNDVGRNIADCLEELSAFLSEGATLPRIAVRTGDTPGPERQAFRLDPPEVLLTTPESLAVLLSQPAVLPLFAGLRWVVVDEIHALAPTKRGADLALSLERLSIVASEAVQRIGLSATAAPLTEAARFLTGLNRPCTIAEVREESPLELRVAPLADGPAFVPDLIRRLTPDLRACRATLIFTNTRQLAERLAWALRRRLPEWDDQIAVHHSSVAAGRRREVEARFKQGGLRVVVSSTSLELGIDVGAVDLVVLVHPPGGVVRLLQRVGRAGHGPGRVRRGLVFTSSPAELLEAVVTGASGRAAQCEPLRVPAHPLDVLCQQLAGMAAAATWSAAEAFALVRRSYPYHDLPRKDFDACLAYLHGLDCDGGAWLPPRLRGDADGFSICNERTARLLRRNLGTILAEDRAVVMAPFSRDAKGSAEPSWSEVGDVDQAFADRLQPGDRFLLDGRCLEFRRRDGATLFVEEASGRTAPPRWGGDGLPLSSELARRLFLLRVQAAEALRDGPTALAELLRREYAVEDETAALLSAYFLRQESVSEIPDAEMLLIEEVLSDQGADYYLHTPLNRKGNDALARVAVHRLARDQGRAGAAVVADLGFALRLRSALADPPEVMRAVLERGAFEADLDAALADSPALRQRFGRTALTGLMLLRNPLGGGRRVGGRDWGERRLFDQAQARDPDFVLLRQAGREVRTDLCDGAAARQYVDELARRPIRCRRLTRPSPFAEHWTQAADGPTDPVDTAAEVLQRLHAALMGTADSR
jgi:ATP-dependent helicase Lhr and Lhr-like helicase